MLKIIDKNVLLQEIFANKAGSFVRFITLHLRLITVGVLCVCVSVCGGWGGGGGNKYKKQYIL